MPTNGEKVFQEGQTYLKSVKNNKGINLYEHISTVLTKILEERPAHVVDIFEDLSLNVKELKLAPYSQEPEELWLTQVHIGVLVTPE